MTIIICLDFAKKQVHQGNSAHLSFGSRKVTSMKYSFACYHKSQRGFSLPPPVFKDVGTEISYDPPTPICIYFITLPYDQSLWLHQTSTMLLLWNHELHQIWMHELQQNSVFLHVWWVYLWIHCVPDPFRLLYPDRYRLQVHRLHLLCLRKAGSSENRKSDFVLI